jgi:hypothetical protein
MANISDPSNEKWWKTKLLKNLSELIDDGGLPWVRGRKLPNVTKKDFSVCYASQESFPDTVAYIDQSRNADRAQ